jgi:hypothetical protein
VWRIAMQFLHLEPIYDEASDDATIFSIGARIEWQGGELYDNILEGEEEATLLGAFMVRNTDNVTHSHARRGAPVFVSNP